MQYHSLDRAVVAVGSVEALPLGKAQVVALGCEGKNPAPEQAPSPVLKGDKCPCIVGCPS